MAAEAPVFARRRALLVATSEYEDDQLRPLRSPAGDAEALAEVLGAPEIGGFEVEAPLVNRPMKDVAVSIEEFLTEATGRDFLLLYISGHGLLSSSNKLYFATADTSTKHLRATALADSWLKELLDYSVASQIVLMLDCCHSGASEAALTAKGSGEDEVGYEYRFGESASVTLTSSGRLEYSFETDGNAKDRGWHEAGSLFTRLLVEGLRTGEADERPADGRIHIDELHSYVQRRVREVTSGQTPGLVGRITGEAPLIARNPRFEGPAPDMPAPAAESPRRTATVPADVLRAYDMAASAAAAAVNRGNLAEDYDLGDFDGLVEQSKALRASFDLMESKGWEPQWVLTPQGLGWSGWSAILKLRRGAANWSEDHVRGGKRAADNWELAVVSATRKPALPGIGPAGQGMRPQQVQELRKLFWVSPDAGAERIVDDCSPTMADYLALVWSAETELVDQGIATLLYEDVQFRGRWQRLCGKWDGGARSDVGGQYGERVREWNVPPAIVVFSTDKRTSAISSFFGKSLVETGLRPCVRARDLS